jgi:hypothetical protein
MGEFLEIHIELQKNVLPKIALQRIIQKRTIEHLQKVNMEYLDMCGRVGSPAYPRIKLWSCQHERYFKLGLKPKYLLP